MQLAAIPGNDIPDGMSVGELTTPDGVRLRYALSLSASAGRGTVCIFQGRAEIIEKYFETVRELNERGFAVALLDFRGQGGSDRLAANPLRGHIKSFRQYDTDVETFMTGLVLPDCPPPYYAVGHSTGGNILLRTLRSRTWFNCAVLSSPLLGFPKSRAALASAKFAASVAVALGFGRAFVPGLGARAVIAADFAGNALTSDQRRFVRYAEILKKNPALAVAGPTFSWIYAAFLSIAELARLPASQAMRTPVMIVAAGDDHVVSTEASRQFAKKVPGVACVVIENARHELLMERDRYRTQFWAAFDAFLEAHG